MKPAVTKSEGILWNVRQFTTASSTLPILKIHLMRAISSKNRRLLSCCSYVFTLNVSANRWIGAVRFEYSSSKWSVVSSLMTVLMKWTLLLRCWSSDWVRLNVACWRTFCRQPSPARRCWSWSWWSMRTSPESFPLAAAEAAPLSLQALSVNSSWPIINFAGEEIRLMKGAAELVPEGSSVVLPGTQSMCRAISRATSQRNIIKSYSVASQPTTVAME